MKNNGTTEHTKYTEKRIKNLLCFLCIPWLIKKKYMNKDFRNRPLNPSCKSFFYWYNMSKGEAHGEHVRAEDAGVCEGLGRKWSTAGGYLQSPWIKGRPVLLLESKVSKIGVA
jgi:hypothetical protein